VGPPIRLVPGLGLDSAAWHPTLRSLGRDLEDTTVVELPGYGRRASRDTDLRPASLAACLVNHCPSGRPVLLVGHSASCQVVVHAAAQHAGVAGLLLVGPTTDPRADSWAGLARRWLTTARHEPPGQVPSLVRQYAQTGLISMARAMEAARHDDVLRVLTAIPCPVLVLRGTHDRICPPDWAGRLVAGRDRRSETVTLPVGGHMLPLTHGPATADVLRRFAATVAD
jgi:pimeloyl-ACP methyl ester carboxylesterase